MTRYCGFNGTVARLKRFVCLFDADVHDSTHFDSCFVVFIFLPLHDLPPQSVSSRRNLQVEDKFRKHVCLFMLKEETSDPPVYETDFFYYYIFHFMVKSVLF